MPLKLEYLSEFFCGYCLVICLCACKRISLDDQYFMSILIIENWNLAVLTELQNKEKRPKFITKSVQINLISIPINSECLTYIGNMGHTCIFVLSSFEFQVQVKCKVKCKVKCHFFWQVPHTCHGLMREQRTPICTLTTVNVWKRQWLAPPIVV